MTSVMTRLVQQALASDPFSRTVTVIDALLAVLLLLTLSQREIFGSLQGRGGRSHSRVLAAVIPPLLVAASIFLVARLAALFE